MKKITIVVSSIILLFSCNSENKQANDESSSNYLDAVEQMKPPSNHKVTAIKVIDVDSYTYVKVDENGDEFWMAITSRPIKIGKEYYYKEGMMMYNFTSKQLNRTFDSIMFLKDLDDQPFTGNNVSPKDFNTQKTVSTNGKSITIDLPKDGISLADLYKNKEEYKGKSVILRGVVTKLNKMIMGKNWIHIQDGSNYQDFYDLTITTKEAFKYSLDDTITFQGIITLNKDFGAGYKYDIIMEEGQLIK